MSERYPSHRDAAKTVHARITVGRFRTSRARVWREFKKVNVKMFGALFFIFLFRTATTQTPFVVDEECLNYTIYPLQYDITIKPYIYNGRFSYDCDLTITVIANVPTNIIELEAKHLVIHGESVKVYKGSQNIVNRPRPYKHDEERGKLIIYLYEPLVPYKGKNTQHYDIKISFRKDVTEDSYGVFLVRYLDEYRKTK